MAAAIWHYCAGEIRTRLTGVAQVRPCEYGLAKVGVGEIGVGDISTAEITFTERSAGQIAIAQARTNHVGAFGARAAQVGTQENGLVEQCIIERSINEARVVQPR